jgi:hypothetical protein
MLFRELALTHCPTMKLVVAEEVSELDVSTCTALYEIGAGRHPEWTSISIFCSLHLA